jgi:hypothetical protein
LPRAFYRAILESGLGMRRSILIPATLLLLAGMVRADDIKLKDGSKISGTIVGFDDNSFKVETSYGFAMVRKDQVVSISVSDAAKKAGDATAAAADSSVAGDKPAPGPAAKVPQPSDAKPVHTASSERPLPPPAVKTPTLSSAKMTEAMENGAAAPAKPAPPEPIREEVNGSTYTNDTYGFRMYKPPSWEVIAGAQSLLPGAIAAMGTNDQTTYLLIGETPAGKSLAGDIDATDQRLRGLMGNFRPLGESHLNVSGMPAVERKFRGSVDQKDWSGTVVFLTHGGQLYTIFGMTLAETDLVQIQENVIARTISSLQFAP